MRFFGVLESELAGGRDDIIRKWARRSAVARFERHRRWSVAAVIGLGATITAIAPAAAQAIPDAGFIRQTLVPSTVADSGSGQRVSGSEWMNGPNQMPKSAEGTAGDHLKFERGFIR